MSDVYADSDIKTIHVLSFTNKKEDWYQWALKFRSMAEERGYNGIIDGTVTVRDDTVDINSIQNDDMRERMAIVRTANKVGYRDLTLAMSDVSLPMVGESKTQELPKGDLHLAWTKLEKKWEPKESEDRVDLFEAFQSNILDNIQMDPWDWLTDLEKNWQELRDIGHDINDNPFLIHVMMSLPKEYTEVVRDIKQKMRANTLDLDKAEKLLKDQCKILKKISN